MRGTRAILLATCFSAAAAHAAGDPGAGAPAGRPGFRSAHRYADKEPDLETGLLYFGARYYDPTVGRFVSPDPWYADPSRLPKQKQQALLANPQRASLYTYVLNNPVRYADPSGLDLQVRGPGAEEFVATLSRYTGLRLELQGSPTDKFRQVVLANLAEHRPARELARESAKLRELALQVIATRKEVMHAELTARSGRQPGYLVDTFLGSVRDSVEPRTVFVGDFPEVERHNPVLARALMAHVLAEYGVSSSPQPGVAPEQQFESAHLEGLEAEADVASELTGRARYSGDELPRTELLPWRLARPTTSYRDLGPQLRYGIEVSVPSYDILRITGPR
ncbi:MAG: RHS repeat-associated core domain-containing protein [Verrucomicrobiia bacterium]